MHLFKTSSKTFNSVISNKKHAFRSFPRNLHHGDIVLISKNKEGLSFKEKQISHYAIFSNIRKCTDKEIEKLWPGNKGRWRFIVEFSEVHRIDIPFNLSDILPWYQAKRYASIMTHGKIQDDDERTIREYISSTK